MSEESFLQIARLGDTASLTVSKSRCKLIERGLRDAALLPDLPLPDNTEVLGQDGEKEPWWFRHSFEEAHRLAEQGDAEAQFALGRAYDGGDVFPPVPQDCAEAAIWYLKAAEQGHVNAQWNLACLYANGERIPHDYTEAFRWVRKAAEQGFDGAQQAVGSLYEYGQGVTQDFTEAVKWYRKAAEQGNSHAQLKLGTMYGSGLGVARDSVYAYMWISLALSVCTDDDQKEYSSALETVAAEMTAQQISYAQALARDWDTDSSPIMSPTSV